MQVNKNLYFFKQLFEIGCMFLWSFSFNEGLIQDRNQLGTPGGANSFLRMAQNF